MMNQTRSSSPLADVQQMDFSLNGSQCDVSLREISSESSKKCSDSDCSLCEKFELLYPNPNGSDNKNVTKNPTRKFRRRSIVLHEFHLRYLFNTSNSSSSSSSGSKNNSSLRQLNISGEEYINNNYYSTQDYNRPFPLENINESFENDESFWNLYNRAFNSLNQENPKTEMEYHKLAEKCALTTLASNYCSYVDLKRRP